MATSSSLIKTILHKSLAEGVYRDVVTKASNYYYFLGKTLNWSDETAPPFPTDSYAYERAVRDDIITLKAISPSDVSFVVPRVNWTSGEVYDMYDDEYCNEILGLNIINGGTGYTSLPTITITGGGGSGAKFYPIVYDGQIIDIEEVGVSDTSRGTGYTSVPTVTVTGGNGEGAIIQAVLNLPYSGASKLEEANMYVMTEDYNVYKCIDNNNNAISTNKPLGTSVEPIKTADGYVWKYMYNVPINLRNKFLSDEQMPVISALTNQFYSNGSLDSIIVNNKGSDYTSATITVTDSDGYRVEDPVFLQQVVVNDGGTGYDTPTVTISDPVSDASAFISSAGVFLGQKIYNTTFDFYLVVTPGTLSTTAPSHRLGTVQNGTAALKFIGSRATAVATTVDGEITQITLLGGVREINIVNSGSGYTDAPNITFSGGGGSGAAAVAKMNADSILYVTVTNPGSDYTSDPTVVFGEQWTAATAVLVGEQYFYSNRLYTVTGAGTTHASTAPSHTSGSATNGTATLQYVGSPATGEVVRRFGSGYSSAPTITITEVGGADAEAVFQTSKSEAKLLPIIDSGQIVGVIVENKGIGYSTAKLVVEGDGENAELVADLNIGTIQSLQANNEILTTPGTINAIKLISGGYGYGVATVEILGDGTGATATAEINTASGKITKIVITNPGQNYTFADIVITGNGHGANARAVMPPYGGHGKNAPDELFARTLMFYSNVSTDLNQGVAVNNDYRQLGIVKNPNIYATNQRFQGQIGSGCFIVESGSINTTNFPRDTDITVIRTVDGVDYDRLYRVVAASTTSALLQSLDNDIPRINDTFTNANGDIFSVSSVGNPTIDKYSGQMMFIDNKAGFTPSEDETVTLRTVIRF